MLNDCYQFKKVMREVTSLTPNDCFSIAARKKRAFNFPLHTHDEMELTLIVGGTGLQRLVGDHLGVVDGVELVLVGPGLPHGWFSDNPPGVRSAGGSRAADLSEFGLEPGQPSANAGVGLRPMLAAMEHAHHTPPADTEEITLLFNKEIFSSQLLGTDQLLAIRKLFEDAKRGLRFSTEVALQVLPRMQALAGLSGFEALLQFLSLLHTLSTAKGTALLSGPSFNATTLQYDGRRLEQALEYMHRHYGSAITLPGIAKIAHMSEASFSRFMKANTGYTFTEKLTEIRLGHVARLLVSSQQTIAEIAYQCGFNNMANFNKLFRRRKGCTPKDFRVKFNGWKGE